MSFVSQIDAFVGKANKKMDMVYREAIAAMIEIASREQPSVRFTGGSFEIGKVPVLTRELAESLIIVVNGTIRGRGPDSIRSALRSVRVGDFVEFGYTADHALPMEYGTSRIQGRFFVTNATNQWDLIVNDILSIVGG